MSMTPTSMTFRQYEWAAIVEALINEAENLDFDNDRSAARTMRRIAREIAEGLGD